MAVNKKKKLFALVSLLMLSDEDDNQKKRNRKVWVRKWLQRRQERGAFHQLVYELSLEDEPAYRDFLRLNKSQFKFVVAKIRPFIEKRNTTMRLSIPPEERLAVTLRYLAAGETFKCLEYSFRICRTLISSIVVECCDALFQLLGPSYLKTPKNTEEWLQISYEFQTSWNFPNGIGAIDGKRVLLQKPAKSGSHFYDYKGHYSIILLAVFAADYKCLWASVGTNGRWNKW